MADRKKSLHVVLTSYRGNMYCGGQGVYLVNLARALVSRGHRVRVISGPPYPDPVEGAEFERLPGENFINQPPRYLSGIDPFSVFSPLTFMEYGLARAGSNPEMLAASLRGFQRVQKLHAKDPVDVVHDNQGLGYGLVFIRAMGIPVVATIHHPLQVDRREDLKQMHGFFARARRAIYYPLLMQKLVARRLDRLVTVSRFSGSLVADAYGVDPERLAVVPNGVDGSLFCTLEGVPREQGRLLFVGSTEDRKKGIIYLLRALAGLPAEFRLVIVDGRRYPGRTFAADAVQRLGLESRVEFKDRISNHELVREYNRAEMMVMPSLFEGFGLPALEAMACATPLICTTAGGLSEVADPECAVMVEPKSADAIMDAVISLDRDQAARARMSKAAREIALSRFSWERAAEGVEKQYLLAIKNREPYAQQS